MSVRGLDCAFTFALTRSGGSHPVSTPSPLGAWLGVASQGSADFESIHARRFRRGVQRAHREVPLESGVLPVTPRGSVVGSSGSELAEPGVSFYLGRSRPATGLLRGTASGMRSPLPKVDPWPLKRNLFRSSSKPL